MLSDSAATKKEMHPTAAALPAAGLSAATTLGFWPKMLTPYVSYGGESPRNRHILVGVTPFLVLSIQQARQPDAP